MRQKAEARSGKSEGVFENFFLFPAMKRELAALTLPPE
jgi:hypothetical protein